VHLSPWFIVTGVLFLITARSISIMVSMCKLSCSGSHNLFQNMLYYCAYISDFCVHLGNKQHRCECTQRCKPIILP
jgi:hypothetical protein